jgi:TetR/AcrR family transcriptional regulator
MTQRKASPRERKVGRGAQRVPRPRFRPAILDAALLEFSEKGFHAAQMSEIAERARVAVGTVYNLFKSKADLYAELVNEHGAEMFAAFSEVLEDEGDPLSRLIEFVRLKGDIYEENRAMLKLFFAEGREARLNVRAVLRGESLARYDTLLQRLTEIFEAGIEGGQIERMNPFDLAVGLDSLSNSFILLHMDHPERHSYTEKIPIILKMFFGSVLPPRGQSELETDLKRSAGKSIERIKESRG